MSEKRKPELVFIAKIYGNPGQKRTAKIEAFHASLWDDSSVGLDCKRHGKANGDRYRIRVDGKWYKGRTFTMSELLVMLRRLIKRVRSKFRSEPKSRRVDP